MDYECHHFQMNIEIKNCQRKNLKCVETDESGWIRRWGNFPVDKNALYRENPINNHTTPKCLPKRAMATVGRKNCWWNLPVFLTSLTTSWQWQVAALSSDWLLRGGHMIVISFSGVLICEYWCDWMIVCHSVSSLWQSRTYLGLNNLSPYDSWHRILLG